MGNTSALSIAFIIISENSSASPFSLMGIISLRTVLTWITALLHFYSWVLFLLQTTLHFLFFTAWKGRAKGRKNDTSASASATPPSYACPRHANVVDSKLRLSTGEVEVVMDKLGIFYDRNGGDDEVRERLGSDDIAALFDEEEEEEELSLGEGREAFDVFDENCDGFIDASELEKVLCTLGFTEVSEVECRRMIAAFDYNRDGLIDFSEFVKLLENCSW